jgi:hypothetical protein
MLALGVLLRALFGSAPLKVRLLAARSSVASRRVGGSVRGRLESNERLRPIPEPFLFAIALE